MVDLDWEMSEVQAEFIFDETKYLLVEGAAGSGKTLFGVMKTLLYGLSYAGARIGVFRQTLPSLKVTAWLEIRNLLEKYGLPFKENKSDGVISFPNGSSITFKPLDDMRKIRSMNLDFIYVEQAEEISKESFEELDSRVRGAVSQKYYPQVLLVVTPETKLHWIYQRFHMHKDDPDVDNIKIVHFHYTDNPFVGDDYIKMARDRKKFDYDNYLRLTLGKWGEVGGLIYRNWDILDDPLKGYEYYWGCCDFGFNNPSCFLLLGYLDGEVYIIDEIYESYLVNYQFIEKIIHLLKRHGLSSSKLVSVFCDAAEPDRIEEFVEYGFNAVGGVKDVNAKINSVKSVKIHINPRCVRTISEIDSYAYVKDRDGNDTDRPQKVNDHAMDALGYGVYGQLGKLSPYIGERREMHVYTY